MFHNLFEEVVITRSETMKAKVMKKDVGKNFL